MRKLTILGVLTAVVMAVVGSAQNASAFSPSYVQSFCTGTASGPCTVASSTPVDWKICYGGAAPAGGLLDCGAGSSSTNIPLGSAGLQIDAYQIVKVPAGSRLTQVVTYTPAAFGQTSPTPGTVTGNVTQQLGVLCDGSNDILADNGTPGAAHATAGAGPWPAVDWDPVPFVRQNLVSAGTTGVPDTTTLSYNGYIDTINPMPSSFADFSVDRANLRRLWLGGTIPYNIAPAHYISDVPAPTASQLANAGWPLVNVTTTSAYVAGLRVSIDLLRGDPDPPTNDFLCMDSPQNSVTKNTTLIAPAGAGDYVRWAALQSAPDLVDGTVTRVLDTQCVRVGVGVPTCGGLGDADGDLVPDVVEGVLGSNPGAVDTDADGATDYDEIFMFTNPNNADTDGDGFLDKQDNLVGFDCVAINGVCTVANLGHTAASDNCPVDANPLQLNSDSLPDWTNTPNTPNGAIYRGDTTNNHQDSMGDVCDPDDDNDGLNDVSEVGFNHPSVQPGCAATGNPVGCIGGTNEPTGGLYCLSAWVNAPSGGQTLVATDPLNPDSDSDGGLDGRECQFGSDPVSSVQASCSNNGGTGAVLCPVASRFPAAAGGADPDGDLLFPNAAETFYRSQNIALPNLAQLLDLESVDAKGTTHGIASCTVSGDTVITTYIPHGVSVGESVSIVGACPGGPTINGTFIVNAPSFSPTTFTIGVASIATGAGGSVTPVCADPNATTARCDRKIGSSDPDSDGDRLNDGVEVKWYATQPSNWDTDGDGCSDGTEAADVNGDHKVNAGDSLGIAQHVTNSLSLKPGGPNVPYPVGVQSGVPAATALSAVISPGATSLTVVNAAGYWPVGKLKINGGEVVGYTGLVGNTFTGLTRGENSIVWPYDAAVTHFAGESVAAEVTAYTVTGVRRDELATYDINKDGKIDAIDQQLVAQLFGNCKSSVGAQTGKFPCTFTGSGVPAGCGKEERSATTS